MLFGMLVVSSFLAWLLRFFCIALVSFYQETDWEDRLRNHLCRKARHTGHFIDAVTQLQSTLKTTLNKIFKYESAAKSAKLWLM